MANVPKILTGVDVIDKSWGGFFQGGSYLCYGHAASGRGLLAMSFLQTGAHLDERCLFISTGRPQDWFIQASTIGFDMELMRHRGILDIMWIPSNAGMEYVDDQGAIHAMEELVQVLHRFNARRVVLNDFMPFLQFRNMERFREHFTGMMEACSDLDMTLMLMLAEPVNAPSLQVVEFMQNHLSGAIHVTLNDQSLQDASRRLTLFPGLGHKELKIIKDWQLPVVQTGRGQRESDSYVAEERSRRLRLSSSEAENLEVEVPDLPYPAQPRPAMVDSSEVSDLGIQTFYDHLQSCFRRYKDNSEDFLLVAIRLEHNENKVVPSILFELLVPAVQRAMRVQDRLFVDMDRERLIILMPSTDAEYVSLFFETLQQSTSEEDAHLGENLLNAFTAIVVPNGQPFGDADEFMEYVLEA